MSAVDEAKTAAAAPKPGEVIRAMLPDHTHVQRSGLGTSWQWTTAGGRWEVTLRTEVPKGAWPFPLRNRIGFAGVDSTADLPADEVGLAGLRALLLALGAIAAEPLEGWETCPREHSSEAEHLVDCAEGPDGGVP